MIHYQAAHAATSADTGIELAPKTRGSAVQVIGICIPLALKPAGKCLLEVVCSGAPSAGRGVRALRAEASQAPPQGVIGCPSAIIAQHLGDLEYQDRAS